MASRAAGFAVLALLLAVAASPAMAANFNVGDSGGWTSGGDYNSWVSGKTFSAGDTLTFTYDSSSHTVVQVGSQSDYDSCSTANALKTDSTSPTVITLKAGTTYYFVCGTTSHCLNGMKLTLATAGGGGGSTTPSTPTTPATPSTPAAATPSTPPATPSTPSTPKPSAAPATVTGTAAAVAGLLAAALLA